jgi:predicted amidohydrolase YtcJ
MKGITRRHILGGGVAAAIGSALNLPDAVEAGQARGQAAAPQAQPDELVFVNGRIHTMDAKNSVVTTVTIRNGRFTAVGGAAPRAAAGRRLVDLRGRTVVPGIIDNHNHIVAMGNRPGYHTPLENATSIADVQATIAARAAAAPRGVWITTIGGFHRNQLIAAPEMARLPTLAELDKAAPNNPVFLSEGFSGPSATNTLGKKFFDSPIMPVPVGADGSMAAGPQSSGRALLVLRQTLLDAAERRRGAIDAINYGLSLGVTTHLDQGVFQKTDTPNDGAAHEDNYTMQLPFVALHRDGLLAARLRINYLHQDATPELTTLKERLRNTIPFFGDDMIKTGGIGEFIGGPKSFVDAAKLIARAGWRAEVHSLSQNDFQQEIADYETANKESSIKDLRWVVAHVPFITEEWVNRLKAIGGGVSLTSWRYLAGTPQQNGPPFKMIVNNGIPAGMSSDGMQIAPMNPWIHMYYAVTGKNARGVLINDGQQISREQVMKLYTASNGWFLREENQLGSIEVGKLGDLVVLNQDYFDSKAVPDEAIRKTSSVMSVVGGKIVHDSGTVK